MGSWCKFKGQSIFLFGWIILFAMESALAQTLPATISKLLEKYRIPVSAVSLDVRNVQTGESLLSLNSNTPRNPASVIKILTTLSALEMLGPSYKWQTEYYAEGPIKNGVLHGDLILKGGGDPFLTSDRFWHQVLSIKQRGIHTIKGDLVIDNTRFHLPVHDRAAFDDKPTRLYNVGPDAALVNFSATRFVFQPMGNRIAIFADPPMGAMVVENNVKPADGQCNSRNSGWQYGIHREGDRVVARFNGTYRKRCGQHSIARSIFSNHEYAYRLFKYLWSSVGGTLEGGYRLGMTPDTATALTKHPSEPLADIITSINKFSNNVMARQLMLTLDAQDEEHAATIDGARNMIGDWLKVNGLPMPDLIIDNGSGLSRKTRITSGNLSDLLQHGWSSNYHAEFISSLSLTALDGTMRKRLKNSVLRGRARIKTGLIKGVRSMAGYVNSKSGTKYSVSLMMQSGSVNYWNGNNIQDALLMWIYDR